MLFLNGFSRAEKLNWVIIEKNGVVVRGKSATEFDGEFKRTTGLYLFILWIVSIIAMITNMAQVLYRKILNPKRSIMQIMWEMGRSKKHISSIFVDRFSRFNHQAKWGAAGWKSLELFYHYWERVQPKLNGNLEGALTRYWIEKMENRQAVTNRLKLAVNFIADALGKFINEPEIRLLSVASGSAQAVIMAMKRHTGLNIKAVLIDADETALQEAERCIKEAGFQDRFKLIHGRTEVIEEVCKNFKPHVVEMIGFLDYRPKQKAIELISKIKRVMEPNGVFITCNIRNNPEKIFLDWVLLWPMIYRSKKQFSELLTEGGFESNKTEVFYEPFGIHGIGVCRK